MRPNRAIAAGTALAVVIVLACIAPPTPGAPTEPRSEGAPTQPTAPQGDAAERMVATVEGVEAWQARKDWEAKPRSMPLYLQTNPAWGSEPYAGSDVANAGCGLTAAAMAYSWLAKVEVTPAELRDEVGDSCTTGGLNDMAKFAAYGKEIYGIACSDRYHDPERAMADALAGSAVACSVRGLLGDNSYGGHIVLMWSPDGEDVWIRDPASAGNSSRAFDVGEVRAASWSYFYTYSKEDL